MVTASPAASSQHVQLVVNGRSITVDAQGGSVLELLRKQGHTGVKHACGEGGCGACAVLVTSGDDSEQVDGGCCGGGGARTVNACLMPVYAADGCHITTADGLPRNNDGVNPVAERLVGFFGSQCGFCTPGMAVACHAALSKAAAQGRAPSAAEMRDGLDGNLCRCTGYRPIVDACKSFACDVDMEDLGFNMFTSKGQPLPEPAAAHMPANPAAGAPRNLASEPAGEEPLADAVVHVAAAHNTAPAGSPVVPPLKVLQLAGSQQVVYVPHSMEQLLQAVQQHAASGAGAPLRVVAGNTGPGVYKDWPLTDPALLYIKQVRELQGVHLVPDPQQPQQVVLRVGAAATLAEVVDVMGAWCRQGQGAAAGQALAAQQLPSKGLAGQEAALRVAGVWSEVVSHLKRVAGSHVRGAATLVGNLVLARSKGLPSDVATLLLAADASVEVVQLRPGSSSSAAVAEPQRVPLAQYLAAKGTAAAADGAAAAAAGVVANDAESREAGLELMTAALIPVPAEGSRFWSSRVAARWSNAASVINAAALWPGAPTATAGGSACGPSFVLGMNLAHEHGPEQWRVAHCSAVEQVLLQGGSLTPQLATTALAALSDDLAQLFSLPPPAAAKEAPAASSTPAEQHFAYLRSTAEGLLLQALAGLLSSTEGAVNGTSARSSAGATDMPVASADGAVNGVNGGANGSSNGTAAAAGGAAVLQAARKLAPPAVASGKQVLLEEDPALAPLTQAWPKESARLQACGQAQYSDDVPLGPGALFAAWVPAKVAAGKVKRIDTSAALAVPGAVRFVGVGDLPVPDVPPGMEPIFSSDIQFYGQPVGLLLGTSYQAAHHAARLVVVECEEPAQPPLLDPLQAVAQGSVYPLAMFLPQYPPGRTKGSVCMGKADVSAELAACPLRLSGLKWHLPSQAHMYMEPQTAVAEVEEDGCVRVHSSTQNLDMVLLAVAGALGLPHHKVEVKCRRLGGGFGGKTTHPNSVAAAAAVAAMVTGKQVHLATERTTDLAMFGGRCQVDTTFDVGFDQEGRILALDMDTVLQAGAYVGWSFFDAEGWANTGDSVYDVPALRLQFTLARTNTLPRSSVRGPGHFPGMVAIESVVECVAAHLGLDPALVRERNMRQPVPAGQPFTNGVGKALGPPDTYTMPRIWKELKESTNYQARVADVAAFNAAHTWVKRGLSLMPCMFPLSSWTRNALVHIYVDGSVRVVHPGVDMGQGLGVKVQQTAAYELSKVLPPSQRPLPLSLIRLADPSTFSLPHNALTGGSTVSDAACAAVRAACAELVSRLRPHAEQMGDGCTWQALIGKLNVIPGLRNIVDLTAGGEANLAPDAGGAPIVGPVYTSFGAALAEAEVDVLTGDRRVVRVDILMDVGKTLNPGVDLGQVEGAFMFGAGYMLHEEVGLDPATGRVTTNTTWHYKVPGAHCVPAQFNVAMLKDSPLPFEGPLGAKSVGEPPLLLSCSVAFALAAAARAAAQQVYGQAPAPQPLQLPLLPQRIKQLCGTQHLQQVIERVAAA